LASRTSSPGIPSRPGITSSGVGTRAPPAGSGGVHLCGLRARVRRAGGRQVGPRRRPRAGGDRGQAPLPGNARPVPHLRPAVLDAGGGGGVGAGRDGDGGRTRLLAQLRHPALRLGALASPAAGLRGADRRGHRRRRVPARVRTGPHHRPRPSSSLPTTCPNPRP
jgi:hypothetical protein